MALQWQNVHVSFGEGVDTLTDPKAVVATKLLKAQNVVYTAPGSLRTRYGWDAFATYAGAKAIAKRGEDLFAMSDATLLGGRSNCYISGLAGVRRTAMVREAGYRASETDCAVSGNILLTVTNAAKLYGASKVTVTVSAIDTGRVIRRSEILIPGGATYVKCVAVGTRIWMFYITAAANEIRRRPYDVNTDTMGLDTHFFGSVTGKYDVSPLSATDFLFTIARNTGAASLETYRFDANHNTLASISEAKTATTNVAVMGTTGERAYVAFRNDVSGALECSVYSLPTLALVASSSSVSPAYPPAGAFVQVAIGRVDAVTAKVIYSSALGGGLVPLVAHVNINDAGVVNGASALQWNWLWMESKPWVHNGIMHMLVGFNDGVQGTSYVMTFPPDPSQVGAIIARQLSGLFISGSLPSVPETATSGVFVSMLLTKQRLIAERISDFFAYSAESIGVDMVRLDHVGPGRFCTAELGGLTYIAGGLLKYYDGTIVGEVGFLWFPVTPVAATSAGGASEVGTHDEVVVWAYTDAAGNVHRSAPSAAVEVTFVPGTQSMNLTVDTLQMSLRELIAFGPFPSRVIPEWYGTQVNSSAPFYRIKAPGDCPNNEPLLTSVTYASVAADADATIASRPQLYTAGGALPNYPPPSADCIFTHQNRLMVISAEDGRIWFSKEYIPGEAPGFNDVLTFALPTSEMPVAGCSFDDKAIIWTENEIHVLGGEFPNDQGAGSTLHSQRIASDVGARDWRSVKVCHLGAFFACPKGVMLLTRGLQVLPAGYDVTYWTDNYAAVTSAIVTPDRDEIRFTVSGPVSPVTTPTGQTIVLNFRAQTEASPYGQWSHFDDPLGDVLSSIVVGGAIYKLSANETVYVETTAHSDDGAWITVDVETANIYPFGRQAAASVRTATVLGRSEGTHAIEMQIAYDDEPVFVESALFSAANLAVMPVEQPGHHLWRQKCSGLRVKLTTYQDGASPNAGVTLSGLVIEAGQKRGSVDRRQPKEARQ